MIHACVMSKGDVVGWSVSLPAAASFPLCLALAHHLPTLLPASLQPTPGCVMCPRWPHPATGP